MDTSESSNKISDIVRLKQMLKKWRKQAHKHSAQASSTTKTSNTKKGSLSRSNSIKGITFLKRTLSFADSTDNNSNGTVPKGFLAVQVGEEMKRFVIPTSYLKHQAFSVLLKEAEEEFGFQQEGVLRIPCEVEDFEHILKMVKQKNDFKSKEGLKISRSDGNVCGSSESQSLSQSHHLLSPMCR